MSARYDLRSEQGQDTNLYAPLPGTTPADFVPQYATEMKSKLIGREVIGCNPARWIYELINNKFTVCDLFDRAQSAKLESPFAWQHPHRLVINGNQSSGTSSSQVLSSVCLDCHFHFVFNMAWEESQAESMCHPSQASWPLRDNQFPWHHLAWVGSESDPNIADAHTKYYPLLTRESFPCSAPACTFQLTLEVSEPRMASWWIALLTDHDAIREQLELAKKQEPSRYEGATPEWANQAPSNLNTYLKNLLESAPEDIRTISKRNKRFAVLFGPRCFSIFRQLEFEETVVDRDGTDEGSFTPKAPEPASDPSEPTKVGTFRGYLEDVRAEVQCLIHKSGGAVERPTFCTPALHSALRCQEIANVSANALVKAESNKLLGVLPNQPREIVVNAYKRQWELLPSKRRALVDALMAVANQSGDEPLSDYAITQSSVFDNQTQPQMSSDDDGIVSQALLFLGLQPPNNFSAESLIEAFRQKLAQEPAQASTARNMLLVIAQNSTDETYQSILLIEANGKMSLDTCKSVLGLGDMTGSWQEALQVARTKLSTSKGQEDRAVYLDALDALADHTNSPPLKVEVAGLRQSYGLLAAFGDSTTITRPVDLLLPVGLENIGNTCYLNSLIQYLYTVKAVRDIAFNFDDFRLDLTDDSIQRRRLGGNKMEMDRGEAVVAQAFVNELADLFTKLQVSDQAATRPSQRLANAVLLATHSLLDESKNQTQPTSGPNPPPLPARPSHAPEPFAPDDADMAEAVTTDANEAAEVGSNGSSQTLIEKEDDSDRSYEKVDDTKLASEGREVVNVTEIDVAQSEEQQTTDLHVEEARSTDPDQTANAETAPDVVMVDAEEPQSIDQKVLNALEHQTRSSGTDQQDVEEVIGSIINRIQAAIRPSSVDAKTGIQMEKMMETFFVTTINYTKKFGEKEYQSETSFDRSLTAFPAPDGPCSLYDALGRNFDQQILEESRLSRYTAIKTLPPVLHVLIQRSQSIGSKNGNPVVIPETLYLDRYMDAPHDSPTFRRRVEDWAIATRIADLKALKARTDGSISAAALMQNLQKVSQDTNPDLVVSFDQATEQDANQQVNPEAPMQEIAEDEEEAEQIPTPESWDFDGPVDEDYLLISSARPTDLPAVEPTMSSEVIEQTEGQIRDMMVKELWARENALEQHLESSKEIAYRLHAVICHRGHLTSGHYWVWIHDFEDDIWRWYNDADVKENKNTEEVLQTLSTSGEPYYLCYVRDTDKMDYVDVPKRQPPAPVVGEEAVQPEEDADGDVALVDEEPTTKVEEILPPYSDISEES